MLWNSLLQSIKFPNRMPHLRDAIVHVRNDVAFPKSNNRPTVPREKRVFHSVFCPPTRTGMGLGIVALNGNGSPSAPHGKIEAISFSAACYAVLRNRSDSRAPQTFPHHLFGRGNAVQL